MKLGTLAAQAALVVGVTATVGYPEFRQPARPVSVWLTAGPLTPRPDLVSSDPRFAYGGTTTSASIAELGNESGAGPRRTRTERERAGDAAVMRRGGSISGQARTAFNQPVPFATMVLRNIRTGRIEARTRADQSGRFEFGAFVSGDYVVEMLAADGTVIAISEILSGAGTADAIVRVSGNSTPRALFGIASGTNPFVASTASEPLGRAADSGLQQTTEPDEEASPRN